MIDPLAAEKARLRTEYKCLRAQRSSLQRQKEAEAILFHVSRLPIWERATLICGYWPINAETDSLPLMQYAADAGKAIALPRVCPHRKGWMEFCQITREDQLLPGAYGIQEPAPSLPALTNFGTALCLTPGLSFDAQGHRLGYGGGYYDRFLARRSCGAITFIGLCPHLCFRTLPLPREATDRAVDLVVTEQGVFKSHELKSQEKGATL